MSETKLLTPVNSDAWAEAIKKLAIDTPHYRVISPNFHHIQNAVLKAGYAEVTDDNLQDVLKTLRARVEPEYDHDAPMLPEAAVSWNLVFYAEGRREQITLRGHNPDDLMKSAAVWREWVNKHADEPYIPNGHSNGARPKQEAQTKELEYDPIEETPYDNEPTTPTGDGWERGKEQCVMISLGTSYNGGKPQLKFDCVGLQYPLVFTKSIDNMKELLKGAGISKPLVDGETWKLGGAWNVEWAKPPESKYRNVQSVAIATA